MRALDFCDERWLHISFNLVWSGNVEALLCRWLQVKEYYSHGYLIAEGKNGVFLIFLPIWLDLNMPVFLVGCCPLRHHPILLRSNNNPRAIFLLKVHYWFCDAIEYSDSLLGDLEYILACFRVSDACYRCYNFVLNYGLKFKYFAFCRI